MDELTKRAEDGVCALDALAMQARLYAESIAMNAVQLGRVLTEAKPMVPHGQWEMWVRENTSLSERTAQNFMKAYKRFDGKEYALGLNKSTIFKLLALPEGSEEAFIEQHDVKAMSSREIELAVRQARAEMRGEIDAAKAREAEATAELAELQGTINGQKDMVNSINARLQEAITKRNEETRRANAAEKDRDELQEMLDDAQAEIDKANKRLLDVKSAEVRGDAERSVSGALTADGFTSAVRAFVSAVFQMPSMGRDFAVMGQEALRAFETGLESVEQWAKDSRKAMRYAEGEIYEA